MLLISGFQIFILLNLKEKLLVKWRYCRCTKAADDSLRILSMLALPRIAMSVANILLRLEQRAIAAESLITALKNEVFNF